MHHRPHAHADDGEARRPWHVLAVLAVAQFMVVLDVTVVNVALPSIGASLRVGPDDLSWVISAYVLCTGGLMLLGGRLGDLVGARRTFLAGLGLFTTASLASGIAGSAAALIAARAAQGAGAALLLPSALALVTTAYSGRQRAVALGVWGALGSAGAAAGVLLGGVITTLLSWRWVFFVNVPIGLVVAAATLHLVHPVPARRPAARLDLAGAVTLVGGLGALVYALDGAGPDGWGSARTLVPLAAAALLLSAFALVERAGRAPLVPPATWRARPLVAGAAVMLGATGILVGTFFVNTLYLQDALDASPLETGLAFLPLTIVILAGAHLASQLVPRAGTRVVMAAGLALAAAGALLLSGAPADAAYLADLLPGMLVLGLGVGLAFVSVSVTAMHDVAHEQAGLASGLMTTAHEVGAALGVATLASVVGGDIVGGYGDAFLVAGAAAAVLAAAALATVPAVRPAAGAAMPLH